MGLDFKLKDFACPFAILKLRHIFNRNQWLNKDMLQIYQIKKLKQTVEFAYTHVPYYRKVFKELGIIPSDIKSPDNLKVLPFLTKSALRYSFNDLVANNSKRYHPYILSTSGTTGGSVKFYVDKPSNVLEFVFYWRFWGWAGYRLADTFAEFSAQRFTPIEKNIKNFCHFERFTHRLMVNSLLLSVGNAEEYRRIFLTYKPKFLKGLPSNLYVFALLFRERKGHGIKFKAVFSQGENLMQYQRELIENVFSTKVYDSYGLMERVAAISQCPLGKYHIHMDYSIIEFIPEPRFDSMVNTDEEYIGEVAGTSLYNCSMPLIRYKTGDYVRIPKNPKPCGCGRTFPVVNGIFGRDSDIIVTADGRAVTALYVALDQTPGIIWAQIIQEEVDRLVIKVMYNSLDTAAIDALLIKNVRAFVGREMKIVIIHTGPDEIINNLSGKFKVIVSRIPQNILLGVLGEKAL